VALYAACRPAVRGIIDAYQAHISNSYPYICYNGDKMEFKLQDFMAMYGDDDANKDVII
jgi:hypothetical protein